MSLLFVSARHGVILPSQEIWAQRDIAEGAASALFQLLRDGRYRQLKNNDGSTEFFGSAFSPRWATVGDLWEVHCTASPEIVSGTINTWIRLNTTHGWALTRNTLGTSTCTLTQQFRRFGETTVQATVTDIVLKATVFSP